MKNTIQNGYEWCCTHAGDIHEHIPILKQYAEKVNHITEFGVRDVISTWAFLAGKPAKVVSYDINDTIHAPRCMEAAKNEGLDWRFIIGDTLRIEIEPTDLLFIDTWHTYDQLKQELARHASKVKKYILMHDTTSFEHTSEFIEGSTKGLWDAIEEFLISNPEWVLKERYFNCNGLTVLERANVKSVQKVSIVIPTWNHLDDLLKPCIESIERNVSSKYDLEFVIVANGCVDGTENYLKELHEKNPIKYRYYFTSEQLGFTKASNIGFRMATADHVMILNNDVLILDWGKDIWLDALVAPFNQDAKVAATGPLQIHDPYSDRDFLVGFCILFRADLLSAFGYFDEIFAPAGGEDVDICIKLQDGGWKTVCITENTFIGWTNSSNYPMYHINNQSYGSIDEYTNVIMPRNGEINRQRHNKKFQKEEKAMNTSTLSVDSANMSTEEISKKEIWTLNTYGVDKKEVDGAHVIDIGAFNGDSALYFKELGATVSAFEMNPDNFVKLVEAIRNVQGISAYNIAVYSKDKQYVQFKDSGGTCKISDGGDSVSIPTTTLDTIIRSFTPDDRRLVLKIDCEGAEFPIIMDTPVDDLRRFEYIYAEIHEESISGHKIEELVKYLADIGFEPQHQPHDVFYYEKDHLGEIIFTKTLAQTYKFIRRDKPVNIHKETPGNKLGVTAYISTKDRYFTTLPLAIMGIANQTFKVDELVVFDDSSEARDLRGESLYSNIFKCLEMKGISWKVIFGEKKGQVANHQKALDMAKTEFIWRVDDDNFPEPNVLEHLMLWITSQKNIGGVGSLVRVPHQELFSLDVCSGDIQKCVDTPNLQWSSFRGIRSVDHLHNTFLYRKSAAFHGYQKDLSPVGHREETLFTHGIRMNGYQLLVTGDVITWHFRESKGGIRAYNNVELWAHDEQVFKTEMKKRGILFDNKKYVVLDNGVGDHYAFKHILGELIDKYGLENIVLATCFPEIFEDTKVKQISIADASMLFGDITRFNVYHWMWKHRWTQSIVDAYRGMYL